MTTIPPAEDYSLTGAPNIELIHDAVKARLAELAPLVAEYARLAEAEQALERALKPTLDMIEREPGEG